MEEYDQRGQQSEASRTRLANMKNEEEVAGYLLPGSNASSDSELIVDCKLNAQGVLWMRPSHNWY